MFVEVFFFQAEDGIRDLVRSRGLGDVYKRQPLDKLKPIVAVVDAEPVLPEELLDFLLELARYYLSLIHI